MELRRTSHAVYDTKYHLVWVPKYRKWILRGDIQERVKGLFEEIAINHEFEIDILEVAKDHVHIFLSFPPRYSISRVVGILKGISASVIFREHPEVKRELWGGEFWEDGYFARTVGDKVTADVIEPVQYCFMLINTTTYKCQKMDLTQIYCISGGTASGKPMF